MVNAYIYIASRGAAQLHRVLRSVMNLNKYLSTIRALLSLSICKSFLARAGPQGRGRHFVVPASHAHRQVLSLAPPRCERIKVRRCASAMCAAASVIRCSPRPPCPRPYSCCPRFPPDRPGCAGSACRSHSSNPAWALPPAAGVACAWAIAAACIDFCGSRGLENGVKGQSKERVNRQGMQHGLRSTGMKWKLTLRRRSCPSGYSCRGP